MVKMMTRLDGNGSETPIAKKHHFSSFKFKMKSQFEHCAEELQKVEDDIKALKSRRLDILRKKESDRDDAEKTELADYDADYAKLEADKKYWQNALTKAQSHLAGIFKYVNRRPK